jgi:hypothetical protein
VVVWLTAEQFGLPTGPPRLADGEEIAALGWVPPGHDQRAPFIVRVRNPLEYWSEADAEFVGGNAPSHQVRQGSVVVVDSGDTVTGGYVTIGYFHVESVRPPVSTPRASGVPAPECAGPRGGS